MARSVRNKVYLITQSNIDYNCSISAITETCLTNDDSALAIAMLFSSELKLISSSPHVSLQVKF